MTKRILSILLFFLGFLVSLSGQEKLIPVADLKADLQFLKNKLENNHPNLYLYTPKTIIDNVFDSLENTIAQPLTALAFYKHITIISSIIKDGHTVILPGNETINWHNTNNSKYLPYHFVILNDHLFPDMAFTNENSIPAGSEIKSINNISTSEIINQLVARQVRDGDNLTYPTWVISNYFRQYYSFIFGHPENFTIGFTINGETKTTTIQGLSKDSIAYYRQQNYPGKSFSNMPNEGITLTTEKGNTYAVLTIKDFHNDVLKKEYKQNFEKVIASFFEQINKNKTKALIIDLRNNQGGDIENGVFLVSYLLDKPFSVVREYFCVDNKEVKHCHGPSLGLHDPKENNFKGKLYVLLNGGSFSNSGIVASCLQANNRAVFIGEETGGNPNVIAGFIKNIDLPNSKIQVQVPTKQFVITDKTKNNGRGLIPEHIVTPMLADILEDKDTVLNYTIELIKKTN